MYTHIVFVRQSTGSELIIKPPCGPFNERLFVDSDKAAEWQMVMYPDWMPMEFLTEQETQNLMEGEHEPKTGS